MRHFFLCILLGAAGTIFSQNTNVAFRSKLTYSGQTLSNIWGYAAGGHEYALVGAQQGMTIVDVTDPDNPIQIVQIAGPSSSWREIKTYSHYAYIVSEGGAGVQIVDLTNLPGANLAFHSYMGNGAINNQLTKAHALHVDETKGYLYVYGSPLFSGKPLVLNLNADPYNPTYVNFVNFIGYAHDGYVNNDILYSAHIYAGLFAIVNMTNKNSPVLLATQATPGAFTHNTWPSGSTLFTTDEVSNSFLSAYDISNTNNITLLDKIQSNPGSGSIVHNTYIYDDYAITSWYKDGFTITDVARPANLVQVGNYDTYPQGAGNGFSGDWGVYPYLPSGNIIVSNISAFGTNNGELWIFTPTYVRGCYLEGTVTHASTGNPLNGAIVQILSTSNTETTPSNGQYKMGQLQSGSFTAQVSKTGFVTQQIPITMTNGVLTSLNVVLQPVSLPVELVSFTVRAEKRNALLQWETASEVDNAGFDVQYSSDGITWKTVGFVPSQEQSVQHKFYEFHVPDLAPGSHFFRLRQTDLNGDSRFSGVRSLSISGGALFGRLLPNVVSTDCTLYLQMETPGQVSFEIFQSDGRSTGIRGDLQLEKETQWPLPVADLPVGTYYVVFQTAQERQALMLVKE